MDRRYALKALTAAATVAVVVVGLLVLWYGRTFFLLGFAGLLLAVTLRGASDWISRRTRFPPLLSLALLVVGITGGFVLIGWFATPNLVDQLDRMMEVLPRSLERLEEQVGQYAWGRALLEAAPTEQLWSGNPDPLARVTGVFSTTLGFFADLLIILFLGLFIAISPQRYFRGALRLVPQARRERVAGVLIETGRTLRRWVWGRLIAMFFVGIATAVALFVLDVPLAISLASLATILTFVPYLGPITSAVPTVLVALLEDPMLALWVLIIYAGIQLVEGYVVTPLVQSRAVSVPPALLLSAQVLFGLLFGLLGVALATPIAAAAMVLVRRFYVEDVLGDRDAEEDGGQDGPKK